MINTDKINQLIQAIQNKDVQAIVDGEVHIPSLGKTNSAAQVQNWLDKRSNYLTQALSLSEAEIDAAKDSLYATLTTEEQVWADKILNNEDYSDIPEDIWEACVLFIIYRYIKE